MEATLWDAEAWFFQSALTAQNVPAQFSRFGPHPKGSPCLRACMVWRTEQSMWNTLETRAIQNFGFFGHLVARAAFLGTAGLSTLIFSVLLRDGLRLVPP